MKMDAPQIAQFTEEVTFAVGEQIGEWRQLGREDRAVHQEGMKAQFGREMVSLHTHLQWELKC